MATQQKRVSQKEIKRETETARGAQYIDGEAIQSDQEMSEPYREEKKRRIKYSPSKAKKAHRRESRDSSEDDDEENSENEKSHDSEMDGFIVDDEEVEEEYAPKEKKHRKKRRVPEIKPLDEEDLEVIRENVGMDLKKGGRLRKLDDPNNSTERRDPIKQEYTMIDTMPARSQSFKIKEDDVPVMKKPKTEDEVQQKLSVDQQLRRKPQDIFGDQKEQSRVQQVKGDVKTTSSANLKDFFNADEIDDPFNTEADFRIAETDIPERLQVKLEGRLLNDSQETTFELKIEAQWILDRITSTFKNQHRLLVQKDASEKIFKVLEMIRVKFLDIPMICKYRRYEYEPELDEEAVWLVFNFDQEYGKFQRAKQQVTDFLEKLRKTEPRVKSYLDELSYAKTLSEINNFNALIRFLRTANPEQFSEKDSSLKRKQPQRKEEIQIARQNRIPEFAKYCFLECGQYQENLLAKRLIHEPPEPKVSPVTLSAEYLNEVYTTNLDVLNAVCLYAAVELSSQPQIRNMVKQTVRLSGEITVDLTDQGRKELDIYHQSYRVKLVKDMPLEKLRESDLYLDIQQCEKANLLEATIRLPKSKTDDLIKFFQETYMIDHQHTNNWNKMRIEVINKLINYLLIEAAIKEVKEEIQQEAESFVISKCKSQYSELLMQGPFQTQNAHHHQNEQIDSSRLKRQEDIIKSKERLCVMSALMHQIDQNNYIVSVAVVDKFGEIQAHKDFMRLLPPRLKRKPQQSGPNQDVQMQADDRLPETEEQKEHKRDKDKLLDILRTHSVDLVVVAANSLEARRLFKQLSELAHEAKISENYKKEAFVIWGKTEVAKLFALSHNSQRLAKNNQQILKQTISLARFEQDPLTEVLNLWSPITAENQALALNLHPMQKLVNQAKLAEGLEEENIKAVNSVGVDLNLVLDHEHMLCTLQFLSGLGPRMAKRLLQKVNEFKKKFSTRGEMLKSNILTFKVYFSVVPFVLIRIADEAFDKSQHVQKFDILDQTRIHHEHYKLAMKIATDACLTSDSMDHKDVDKTEQNRLCKQVIANPQLVENLDLKAYYSQLDMTNQGNMKIVIQHIYDEFKAPFKDPRQARSMNNLIKPETLFYLLIDETERTFKIGQIVTATVTKVIGDHKVICRLENGLMAVVTKDKLFTLENAQKLESVINVGYIVTGRIHRIITNPGDKEKFEVELNCKEAELKNHAHYIDELAKNLQIQSNQILDEDYVNLNFTTDPKNQNQGRFIPRRIAHEKFKNISSKRAQAELAEAEVGDFVFRPSTRSEDNITLTWKFWNKQFVHIDIQETEKLPGAAIGQRLIISSEVFENLREIVERYIIPCNRLVREVVRSPKFVDTDRWEIVEESLRTEKNADRSRIPYRFVILPQYQQHVLLAYLPKEKVVKEFIKVRPKGYYFHEQNLTPFVSLVNWFKENWQTKDYQRHLRRQRSPRPSVKVIPQIKETPGEQDDQVNFQANGGGSVHSYNGNQQQQYSNIKTEVQKSFGRGQRNARKDSPSQQWGDSRNLKQENQGGRSPNAWVGRDNQEYNHGQQNDAVMADSYGQTNRGDDNLRQQRSRQSTGTGCFKCGQEGHFSRECPNQTNDARGGRPGGAACHKCGQEGHFARECQNPSTGGGGKSRDCYKCKQPGHMARDCPQQDEHEDRGGYKRQRRDDNAYDNQANYGGSQDAQKQTGGWKEQGSSSGWGNN